MASCNTRYIARAQGRAPEAETIDFPTITGADEVLIQWKAIAMNPADAKSVYDGHRVPSWPFVPGLDGAGTVVAIGENVKNVAVGNDVLATFGGGDRGASYQSYAVVDKGVVAKKPADWSFDEAATLGVSFYTAVAGLGMGLKTPMPFLHDGAEEGFTPSSVLVLGASSALGAATVQLLRLALPHATIIASSSSKHHTRLSTILGAHNTVDRTFSDSLLEQIRHATPTLRGVEAIVDTVGAGTAEKRVFEAFDPEGPKRYAQVWTGDDEIPVPEGVDSFMFRSRDVASMQGGKGVLASLQSLLETKGYRLPLPVREVGKGLDQLPMGLEMIRSGASGEKLVVSV